MDSLNNFGSFQDKARWREWLGREWMDIALCAHYSIVVVIVVVAAVVVKTFVGKAELSEAGNLNFHQTDIKGKEVGK